MRVKGLFFGIAMLVLSLAMWARSKPASAASPCSPVTSTISAPFSFDGAGSFCWQSSNLGGYINSWNTDSVTINGVSVTNLYMASGSYPAPINGYWYIGYSSSVAWGHFEAAGTGGGTTPVATNTTGPTATRTPTVAGPTATRTATSALPTSTPASTSNLLANPGMESGTTSWVVNGAGTLSSDTSQFHGGARSLKITGRTASWNGIGQNVATSAFPSSGQNYSVSVWVRAESGAPTVVATLRLTASTTTYVNMASVGITANGWTLLSGTVNVSWSGTLTGVLFYVETAAGTDNFFIDDASLTTTGSGPTPTRTATVVGPTPTRTSTPSGTSYTLTVSKTGTGSGTVTSSPAGISCGATCSASYASGTSVTLTASPASGATFAGWSGACSGSGACVVSMTQARSVTATFNGGSRRSAGCGKPRTLQNGTHTIQSGGVDRTYILTVPSTYNNTTPYRLVFGYHWRGGTATDVATGRTVQTDVWAYYGLLPRSNNTTIFIAPQGIDNGWANTNGRDIDLTDAILAQVQNDLCIDQSRIFATGFSYGAAMSYAVACARPNVFRAVAVIAGGVVSGCSGGTAPVAYLGVHGISDTVLPISGGRSMRDRFVVNNGYALQNPPEPAAGSKTHICTKYQGGQAAYPVEWCAFDGGHMPAPQDGVTGDSGNSWVPGETWAFFTRF